VYSKWRSEAEEPAWVGEVQDVHGGERVFFQGLSGLLAYLERRMAASENKRTDLK